MKTKNIILFSAFIIFWSCKPSIEESVDLTAQDWIHGSENCEDNLDPPIQVVKYNSNTWILRQNKCTNYEPHKPLIPEKYRTNQKRLN